MLPVLRRLVYLLPLCVACSPPVERPNVLFLMWDTVRADRCSVYDERLRTTPSLAALAARGLVYENAIAPGIRTAPSHASLFTGFPISVHGVKTGKLRLADSFETLAESFAEAGYRTLAATSNNHITTATNLVQGFEVVLSTWKEPLATPTYEHLLGKRIEGDLGTELTRAFDESKTQRPSAWFKEAGPVLNAALLDWIDTERGRDPFFAYVNYMEAHIPRIPSADARRRFLTESQYEAALQLDRGWFPQFLFSVGALEYSQEELAIVRALYDAALFDLDTVLGDLMGALEERGLADSTIVVVVGDHGECLGEKHILGHRFSVHDSILRVPLVIAFPRELPPARIRQTVNALDLHATLLELAGVPGPDTPSSVLPLREDGESPERWVISEAPESLQHWMAGDRLTGVDRSLYLRDLLSVSAGEWKLVAEFGEEPALFHPETDAPEASDLSSARPQARARLLSQLLEWRRATDRLREELSSEVEPAPFSDQDRERLEALGYVGGNR